ncbi:hypothetical protein P8C59_009112 [Phyllachora maydis]|uniref:Sexual development protein n=1 Tax=Phyllachora maydis TaxID=1825666 RepID=A0AAD9MFW0_9PEZI|nr:hypothetical protein P8C59_009112 [Phyllachora maydis]
MRACSTFAVATAALAGLALARPSRQQHHRLTRRYTTSGNDGWPAPNPQQLQAWQTTAGGALSTADVPKVSSDDGLTAFQLIAVNEEFEVAFFSSLIDNITAGVPGFQMQDQTEKDQLLAVLTMVKAQEQVHAMAVKGILEHFNAFLPPPCDYTFPSQTLDDALDLAETFTSVVLGTLQDAQQTLAKNQNDDAVRALASVIGNEGEQNGYYRQYLSRLPTQKPFVTTSVASYAYSALQMFMTPGSCNWAPSQIALKVYPVLTVNSGNYTLSPNDQTIIFTVNLANVDEARPYVGQTSPPLFITYFTGQSTPISEAIFDASWSKTTTGEVSFTAFFPYTTNLLQGLTIAALTTTNQFPTHSPAEVEAATLAAPGLIKVNAMIPSS